MNEEWDRGMNEGRSEWRTGKSERGSRGRSGGGKGCERRRKEEGRMKEEREVLWWTHVWDFLILLGVLQSSRTHGFLLLGGVVDDLFLIGSSRITLCNIVGRAIALGGLQKTRSRTG